MEREDERGEHANDETAAGDAPDAESSSAADVGDSGLDDDTPGREDGVSEANAIAPTPEFQRVCRKCSAQVTTAAAECPACGTPYTRRSLGRRAKFAIVATVLAAIAMIGGGIAFSAHRADVRGQKTREAERAQERRAEDRERDREERERESEEREREEQDAAEAEAAQEAADLQAMRGRMLKGVEKTITADAKKKAREGVLTGPILLTSCDPVSGGIDDSTATTEKYDCVAANERKGANIYGYGVSATANFDTGDISWKYTDF